MARKIGWLTMESKRDREKRERKYVSRMFPLGEGQKEAEEALLKQLIPSVSVQDALYQYLQVKEILLEEDEEDREDLLSDWKENRLTRRLSPEEQNRLFAMARLVMECDSLEKMPDAETILKSLK
ncbi:MAG: hypothetical protein ACLTKI_02790 [Lachnospiraceae bacterium]